MRLLGIPGGNWEKTAEKMKLQANFIAIACLNTFYRFIPFFFLKTIYLRIFGIEIGKSSCIHRGARFFSIGKLKIGQGSVVNFNCYLDNRRGIYIGNNVGIAHDCKIYTLGHDLNDPEFKTIGAPVRIHDNAFLFSNCIILPGVKIGEGAVVLSGAIVTKNLEPYTVYGGNPAKKIKERIRDVNYRRDYRYWFAL